jgi:GT2 family glycosyltransferase
MPTLSIIIVNYNTRKFLKKCLASVYAQVPPFDLETIVVDNNSHDGSIDMLRENFKQVIGIENAENVGFSRANNLGIEKARGRFILLLNSDTEIMGNALEILYLFLDNHPEVGVVTPRLVYPDFTDQGVARAFPTPVNSLLGRRSILTRLFPNNRFSRKYLLSRTHTSEEPFEIDWGSGACLMLRKEVIEDTGLLDEDFFMYWEDADLCFRAKQKEWSVYCVPEAVVIHHEGKSAGSKSSNRLIIEFNRSAYHYYRKHHIRSSFDVMNLVAICGLASRTLLLLAANLFKERIGSEGERRNLSIGARRGRSR